MEIWNLVFMQFNRDKDGKQTLLPKPSVDTGAGLERLASVLQGVDTNYDIDIFKNIIEKTGKLAKKTYDPKSKDAFPFRVIADHSRAAAFLIADGVLPSNEGRGYVLRRIIRRAIRYGRKLDLNKPFLNKTAGYVIDQMKDAFPELENQRAFIQKAILAEEEQFLKTLEKGLTLLDIETKELKKGGTLSGEIAFKLYDTFGFPIDLTRIILEERGIQVDEAGFSVCMEKQKSGSRKNWKGSGEAALNPIYQETAEALKNKKATPEFVGYDDIEAKAKCIAIFTKSKDKGHNSVKDYDGKDIIEAVFAKTPFYGESGGQAGDKGLVSGNGFEGQVIDVQKPVADLIVAHIKPLSGKIQTNKTYSQQINTETRRYIASNHTATHLLHWALREVLGTHVKQAGSLVTEELLRFDFSHFNPMTPDEIEKVENLINEKIWAAETVSKKSMSKEKAIDAGAIAFFGEKYGKKVRVVSVGDFSVELCGGTHVDQSSEISMIKIANESGIAAGVRRIVAYTSKGAFNYLRTQDESIKIVRDTLKASSSKEIMPKLLKLMQTEKDLKKQIEKLQSAGASSQIDDMIKNATDVAGLKLISEICAPNEQGVKFLRDMCERIKQKSPNAVVVLGMADEENSKAFLLAAVGNEAMKQVKANDLIKELGPVINGRGGGKPDMAQAGGSEPALLKAAIEKAQEIVAAALA